MKTQEPTVKKQYPLPLASLQVIEKEVDSMLKLGVIEPAVSPYCAPVVLVGKKDGSVRFCVDYRDLNKVTVSDAEPIPDMDQLFSHLAEKTYLTKIDLAKGYWQIPMEEDDKPKTAFATPQGLFQFVKMPFGLVTAPATFARMMRLLELQKFSAINYFDDILIASETWKRHLAHVDGVLTVLEKAGLTARPSKIHAGFTEIEFLGHIVGDGRLRPEKSKLETMLSVSKPKSKKQVCSLMGLVGYYRKFVPNFASLAAPISSLLKKDQKRSV